VVAPLRIARGVQNKVLEAMAMARAIVVSRDAAAGIEAKAGIEFEVAATPREFAAKILMLLGDPAHAASLGKAARIRVLTRYGWASNLSPVIAQLRKHEQREGRQRGFTSHSNVASA
jgi:glycosyltransferase involved in cell wall biosynthesis